MLKQSYLRNITLVIILIIGLLVGAGGYMVFRQTVLNNQRSPQTPSSQQHQENVLNGGDVDQNAMVEETISGTFMDVAKLGKDIQCTWSAPAIGGGSMSLNGMLYASQGMVRTDAKNEVMEGMVVDAHMIYRDGMVYMWGSMNGMQAYGTKYPQEKMEVLASDITPEMKAQAQSILEQYSYQCKPWTPDDVMFMIPSDVKFQEG
ncbi:MAG: hypothetical protein N3A54_02860 [Patescibacteria group bacterium]|nr:hypothetical protein [Patescibacteria group bacterium]